MDFMTKEKFLTVRWNNLLTLGLGLVALIYIVLAFTVIILIRLALNLYTNNVLELTPAQYENYPFRIP
jgi:hypothetical protein